MRIDLVALFVCNLLKHMKAEGHSEVRVEVPAECNGEEKLPWIDPNNWNPGYFARGVSSWPKRLGNSFAWQHSYNYEKDAEDFPTIQLDGPVFHYCN
jgi:hypothetical protein